MRDKILEYWNDEKVESMYDRNLLGLEIESISSYLNSEDAVLDAGCGEAETTRIYSEKCRQLIAADFSETRLALARKALGGCRNVTLQQVDFMEHIPFGPESFTTVISQRFLINIPDSATQYRIVKTFHGLLKEGGRLLLLEGFRDGTENLNAARKKLGLKEIPVKWHNTFFDDNDFERVVKETGFQIEDRKDFSIYFLISRVINAKLKYPGIPAWDDEINRMAVSLEGCFPLTGMSRLKLYVLRKKA